MFPLSTFTHMLVAKDDRLAMGLHGLLSYGLCFAAVVGIYASSWQWCGNTSYYMDKQQCCNGQLFDLYGDGEKMECCKSAGDVYKAGSQICCGAIYNKTDYNSKFQCCHGQRTFIPEEEQCCADGSILKSNNERGCCGRSIYKKNSERCCGDRVYTSKEFKGHCCGNATYDNTTHDCHRRNDGDKVLLIYRERCGSKIIDTRFHTCCHGVPISMKEYHGPLPPTCCGKHIIWNHTEHHCRNHHILSKNMSWCLTADVPFHPLTEWCCGPRVIPRSSCKGCCGGKPYNGTDQCCGGSTIVKRDEDCCNGRPVDEKHVCCTEGVSMYPVEKDDPHHDSCCHGKSGFRATCTSKPATRTMCGDIEWDEKKDECCSNVLHEGIKAPDIVCCGGEISNTTYQVCVSGQPVNRTARGRGKRNRECGTALTFRRRRDLCCSNVLYKNAKRRGKSCCGAEVYSKKTQDCCHGRPSKRNSCNVRSRRTLVGTPHLMCASRSWLRKKIFKNLECIQHAYLMKRIGTSNRYRTKKDFTQKRRRGILGTWNTNPFCNHVQRQKRFLLVTAPTGNYTLKYSKKNKKLIKRVTICPK